MGFGAKAGITKLSELEIDADKDWGGRGISNIKEIVEGMAVGDIFQHDGTKLVKLQPGTATLVLTSAGSGKVVGWSPGGAYFFRYVPASLVLDHEAETFTPDHDKALTAPMTSPHTQTTTPTEAPELALEAAAVIFTPDQVASETLPLTTPYETDVA